VNTSGRSRLGRCAASSMRTDDAPSMAPAITSACLDPADRVTQIESGEELRESGVRARVGRADHGARSLDGVGMRPNERRREPSIDDALGDIVETRPPHQVGPLVPEGGGIEVGGRAAHDEPVDALGELGSQTEPDHPAEREPAERGSVDPEAIHDGDDLTREILGRHGATERGRRAVPSMVVPHHSISMEQGGQLRIPHRPSGRERVRQHDDGSVARSVDPVGDVVLDRGHLVRGSGLGPYATEHRG
jgi:hypothetical protein